MNNIFTQISDLLSNGRPVALCRIIQQTGSAPRATGVNCLVLDDGSLRGTIGGGRLEYEVTTKAKGNFTAGRSFLQHFELTGAEVAQTEKMICGGVVDVYTEYFAPENEAARSLFRRISAKLREGKRGVLMTLVGERQADNTNSHVFLDEDGDVIGTIPGLALDADEKAQRLEMGSAALIEVAGAGRLFVEPVAPDNVLYLFGAGHISTCLAPLAKMIGFMVVVIDDREEFCNRERFPQADEVIVAPFTEIFNRIVITPTSYLAILTRGHIFDHTVLQAALRHSPAYIGMIGSRRKIDMIYRSLLEEGVSQARIQQVYAPIGLPINAESPEEIAVCIAAELIKIRADLRKNP
jgi:xanthine dehydrogenase accessory factor